MNKNNFKEILECGCIDCEELHDGKCRLGYELEEDGCEDYSIMITTAIIAVKENENDKDFATFYRQYDGYPKGLGKELLKYIQNKKVVNGFTSEDKFHEAFNGIGDFCASLVAYFKKDIGDFYIVKADTRNVGEEYIYTIIIKEGEPIKLICYDVYEDKINFSI